jgi:hypothetical protein
MTVPLTSLTTSPRVHALDRRHESCDPRNCDLSDSPTQYLVLFANINCDIAWRKKSSKPQLREKHEVELRHRFEMRFVLSSEPPCAGVKSYEPVARKEDYDSPDEFLIVLYQHLCARR